MSDTIRKTPSIEELITHMNKHKDAVIVIGDRISPEIGKTMLPVIEGEETEQEKIFTRKALIKESNKFWDYYFENIYYTDETVPQVYSNINKLKKIGLAKNIISTDMRHQPANISDLELRGISTVITCNKCEAVATESKIEDMKLERDYKCPACGNRLRPDCLLYGENYHPNKIKLFTQSIFKQEDGEQATPNTHTLILIGVDMQEDLISEMYDNYLLVRERIEEPCYIVMITDNEQEVALFTQEFATVTDIDNAVKRFVDLF